MTREAMEAMGVKTLEQEPCEDWYDVPSNEMILKRARQASKDLRKRFREDLEQEPSGDAISRQAVQDYVAKYLSQYLYNDVREAVEVIDEYIGELPSVNPTKTGHWILKGTFPTKLYDENLNEYKCSECYREIRCTESQLVNFPYCHCGARMVEPQESEDKE